MNSLVASTIFYPILHRLIIGQRPIISGFSISRRAVSTVHSTLLTGLALVALRKGKEKWESRPADPEYAGTRLHPMISARSAFANELIGWEAGYLLQDTGVLILDAWLGSRIRGGRLTREMASRALLLLHHGAIGLALGWFQWYVARGREKGAWVILFFTLMNASTPIGNLRWYLVKFHPFHFRTIAAVNTVYLAAFALFRVYLVYHILAIYGAYTGESVLQTFKKQLRLPCQIGMSSLAVANSVWLVRELRRSMARYGIQKANQGK